MYQKANETPSEYIQSFQAMIKSVEAVGGEIGGGEHVYKYLAGIEGVDLGLGCHGTLAAIILSSPPWVGPYSVLYS